MKAVLLSDEEIAYLSDLLTENLEALAEHLEPETVREQVTTGEMLLDKLGES